MDCCKLTRTFEGDIGTQTKDSDPPTTTQSLDFLASDTNNVVSKRKLSSEGSEVSANKRPKETQAVQAQASKSSGALVAHGDALSGSSISLLSLEYSLTKLKRESREKSPPTIPPSSILLK